MEDHDFEVLKNSNCMPTMLPSCSFFLGIPYGPANKLIENGLPVALASDYNPGSSPSGNMNFIASLGCIQMKMTPEQVINMTTITAALHGYGKTRKYMYRKINFFITKEIPSYAICYSFGDNIIEKVVLNGKII